MSLTKFELFGQLIASRRLFFTALLATICIVLTSCAQLGISAPTPTPVVFEDCVWYASAMAWIDDNGNGVLDGREKPLANVTFYVDDTLNNIKKVGRPAVSDAQGQAQLGVFLPGCPRAAFEVYVDV